MQHVFWYRWLRWSGWGENPYELRQSGISILRLAIPSAIIVPIISAFLFARFKHHLPTAVDFILGLWCFVFIAPYLCLGLLQVLVAKRGMRQGVHDISGPCWEVREGLPDFVYARIGFSVGTALWYRFPEKWEPLFSEKHAQFYLRVFPGCGYVQQLRSTGPLFQKMGVVDLPSQPIVFQPKSLNATPILEEGPTKVERQALAREVRSQGWYWGEPFATIAVLSRTLIGGAIALFVFLLWLIANELGDPASTVEKSTGYSFLDGMILLMGLVCLIWGIIVERKVQHIARVERQSTPTTVTGYVINWAPYSGIQTCVEETLVALMADDGQRWIFRCAPRFGPRVRKRNTHLSIKFFRETGHVLMVKRTVPLR